MSNRDDRGRIWNEKAKDKKSPLMVRYIKYNKKKIVFPSREEEGENTIVYEKDDDRHRFYLTDYPYYYEKNSMGNKTAEPLTLAFIQTNGDLTNPPQIEDSSLKLKNINAWEILNSEGLDEDQREFLIYYNTASLDNSCKKALLNLRGIRDFIREKYKDKQEKAPEELDNFLNEKMKCSSEKTYLHYCLKDIKHLPRDQETLERIYKQLKTKCWILDGNSKWEYVGNLTLIQREERVEIVTHSQIFPNKNLSQIVTYLQDVLIKDLFASLDISQKEYTDSLKSLIYTLKEIANSVGLLHFKCQKVLIPYPESIPQRSIKKFTPYIYRKLLKKADQTTIFINRSKELPHPAYSPLIKDLLDALGKFKDDIQYQRGVLMGKNGDGLVTSDEYLSCDKELTEINNLVEKIQNSQFVKNIITSSNLNLEAPATYDLSFLQHQINMNLYANINRLKEQLEFDKDKSVKDQFHYYRVQMESVKISVISKLYEKWVGVKIIEALINNFNFSFVIDENNEESKANKKEICKGLLFEKEQAPIRLYNKEAGCSVEISYEPTLIHATRESCDTNTKKQKKNTYQPDFKLKFSIKGKAPKTLVIDAKYAKYDVDNQYDKAIRALREDQVFHTSIKSIAEKYHEVIEEDNQVENVVFIAHPDKAMICNPRREVQKERDAQGKSEDNSFWFDVLFTKKKFLHFGAITLYPEDTYENMKQLGTLFTMILRHHLEIVNWCWECNEEAIYDEATQNKDKQNNQYICRTQLLYSDRSKNKHWWDEYTCTTCKKNFYIGQYTYISFFLVKDWEGWWKKSCPKCRQIRLETNLKGKLPNIDQN